MNDRSASRTRLFSDFFTVIIGVSLVLVVAAEDTKDVKLPVNLFDGNSDNLTSDGKQALYEVVTELRPNSSTEFIIEWFGDAKKQAEIVKEYLTWEGIEPTRMLMRSGQEVFTAATTRCSISTVIGFVSK